MAKKNNIYESLLQQGYSKREVHAVLQKCVLEIIRKENEGSTDNKEIASQANTQSFKTARKDDITPAKNHPHPLVYFLRKVNIRKHVIGKALSLLKSQFAKKPKNPV